MTTETASQIFMAIMAAGITVWLWALIMGLLIWFLVVQSDNATIRWQVFQTLHIAHALWPPFLVMWYYRIGRRRSRVFVENLISSAESLD